MQNPCIIGIACWWHSISLPSYIIFKFTIISIPFEIERRISHNVIHLDILMLVIGESRYSSITQMVADTSNSQVHLCQTISGRLRFLTINIYCLSISPMCFNKFCCLNKHTSRATARVINCTIKWLYE